MRNRLLILASLVFVLALSGTASAQQTTFYLERIQPAGAPDDGITVIRPYMSEKTRFYANLSGGGTLGSLRARNIASPQEATRIDDPMEHQGTMWLTGGAEFIQLIAVQVQLPIGILAGGGADPTESIDNINGLDRGAAGHDLRMDVRVQAFQSDNRLLRLGGGVTQWFPTGNSIRFASDDEPTTRIYVNGEFDFKDFLLAGDIGPHFRPDGLSLGTLNITDELRFASGAYVFLRDGEYRLGGELWGTTGMGSDRNDESTFFSGQHTAVEGMANIRFPFTKTKKWYLQGGGGTRLTDGYGAANFRVFATVGTWTPLTDAAPRSNARHRRAPEVAMHDKDTDGDGYPDSIDLCPTIKEDGKPPRPDDGCPAPRDRDGDGIYDHEDKCPDDPEDIDGIEDHDGCPETDADGDGILDVDDACPTVKGVKTKDPKTNGCPKKKVKHFIEEEGELKLLEPIQFEYAKDTIKKVSFPILDDVVELLMTRPDVRMAIHGHTDSMGGKWFNLRLSKSRAKAVMDYLVGKGVRRGRLESEGFGPNKPKADNSTEAGRARNRRVEFRILEDDD